MFRLLIFLILLLSVNSLNAEDSYLTLKQQLDRLQREVSDLSKSVYSDSNENINSVESSTLSTFDLRIYELENEVKNLNSSFEELIFQIDDLKKIYENLNVIIDEKFANLHNNILLNTSENIKNNQITDDDINVTNNSEENIKDENTLGELVISNNEVLIENDTLQNDNQTKKENNIEKSPEEEFQSAINLLLSQKFDEAEESLTDFIIKYEDNNLSGSAHYWLGEIYILKKEFREAALVLAEGFQKFPNSIKAPDILYKLSDSLLKIEKIQESCNTLIKLNSEFPKNKFLEKSKNKLKELKCDV